MNGTLVFRQNLSTSNALNYFSGQWNAHNKSLTTRTFTDLVLVPDSGQIEVHIAVLMPLLPYLTDLVLESLAWWREVPVILLPGIKLVTVERMVDLFYSGACHISCPDQKKDVEHLMVILGLIVTTDTLVVEYKDSMGSDINVSVVGKEDLSTEKNNLESVLNNNISRGQRKHDKSYTVESNHLEHYDCLFCSKVFHSKRSLSLHMKCHSDKRPYACSSCDKTYQISHHLTYHIECKHSELPGARRKSLVYTENISNYISGNMEDLNCKLCGYLCYSQDRLKFHMEMKHEVIPTYVKMDTIKKRGRPKRLSYPTSSISNHVAVVPVKELENTTASETIEDIRNHIKEEEIEGRRPSKGIAEEVDLSEKKLDQNDKLVSEKNYENPGLIYQLNNLC